MNAPFFLVFSQQELLHDFILAATSRFLRGLLMNKEIRTVVTKERNIGTSRTRSALYPLQVIRSLSRCSTSPRLTSRRVRRSLSSFWTILDSFIPALKKASIKMRLFQFKCLPLLLECYRFLVPCRCSDPHL